MSYPQIIYNWLQLIILKSVSCPKLRLFKNRDRHSLMWGWLTVSQWYPYTWGTDGAETAERTGEGPSVLMRFGSWIRELGNPVPWQLNMFAVEEKKKLYIYIWTCCGCILVFDVFRNVTIFWNCVHVVSCFTVGMVSWMSFSDTKISDGIGNATLFLLYAVDPSFSPLALKSTWQMSLHRMICWKRSSVQAPRYEIFEGSVSTWFFRMFPRLAKKCLVEKLVTVPFLLVGARSTRRAWASPPDMVFLRLLRDASRVITQLQKPLGCQKEITRLSMISCCQEILGVPDNSQTFTYVWSFDIMIFSFVDAMFLYDNRVISWLSYCLEVTRLVSCECFARSGAGVSTWRWCGWRRVFDVRFWVDTTMSGWLTRK